jgi:hypothetical protein
MTLVVNDRPFCPNQGYWSLGLFSLLKRYSLQSKNWCPKFTVSPCLDCWSFLKAQAMRIAASSMSREAETLGTERRRLCLDQRAWSWHPNVPHFRRSEMVTFLPLVKLRVPFPRERTRAIPFPSAGPKLQITSATPSVFAYAVTQSRRYGPFTRRST